MISRRKIAALRFLIVAILGLQASYSSAANHLLADATQVAVGENHSCAVLKNSTAACWGNNDGGELGNPLASNYAARPVPVLATPTTVLTGVVAIAAGTSFTCSLQDSGSVYCWGKNVHGSLGIGSEAPSAFPAKVAITERVLAITARAYHACALLDTANRTVRCWGDNASGQLGDNSTYVRTAPVDVEKFNVSGGIEMLTSVDEISAGSYHTCARTGSNVWCWGSNSKGQSGQGNFAGSLAARAVKSTDGSDVLAGATQISAGAAHSCAFFGGSATVNCWGDNTYGQIGSATVGNATSLPTLVAGVDARSVAAGGYHTAAVLTAGRLSTWGSNDRGQLGNNTTTDTHVPGTIGIRNVAAVSGESFDTCALLLDGSVSCWGDNSRGQIGSDIVGTTLVTTPTAVVAVRAPDTIFSNDFE